MSKVLVAYYSAQNHTREISEKIAKYLNADTFEIVPEKIYSDAYLDWTDNSSRVCKEFHNEISRDIKLIVLLKLMTLMEKQYMHFVNHNHQDLDKV